MSAWTAFYWGDYLRDTQDLDLLQHGAYFKLLAHYYSNETSLPRETSRLYRIAGAFSKAEQQAVDQVVSRFFTEGSNGYNHNRADLEIAKRQRVAEDRAKAGRRGAEKRHGPKKIHEFPKGGK